MYVILSINQLKWLLSFNVNFIFVKFLLYEKFKLL